MSNAIRYDSLLVQYLARELDERLRARRIRAIRFDSEARRFTLEMAAERLVWELHPERGWIRVLSVPAEAVADAAEGWSGRRIRTQRRPRVRRVSAPPDERLIDIDIDAGGPDRASRFVVELMTNQWNVFALSPDGLILTGLRSRDTADRRLRAGAPYTAPEPNAREGGDEPVPADRWDALLSGVAPAERARTLVRTVAWTSPLNARAILGPAAADPAPHLLGAAWARYAELAALPEPRPRVLELGRPTPYPLPLPGVEGSPAPSILAAFEMVAEGEGGIAPEVRAAIEARLARAARLADRLRDEAETAPGRAGELRRQADLLMTQMHRAERGARTVELDDFQGGTVSVELDPARSAAENARVMYDRARKRERAAARLPERVRAAEAERDRLGTLVEALDAGTADPAEARRWIDEVRPRRERGAGEDASLPYRRFRSSGGLEIRVGRSGRANDDLTFRHSSPEDIWLHARTAAGAHVILRWTDRDQGPPRRDLIEAAVLAALNSRARTSGAVPVDWTRRKYIRKPRKAPPGAVIPDRVETLFVEPDPSLPDRLEVR